MEARLGETAGVPKMASLAAPAPSPTIIVPADDVEPVPAVEAAPPGEDAGNANWPDESAESAFLATAREHSEPVVATKAQEEIGEETDSKALPPLNDLVQRIPAEVREVLEDLFRARFVSVKRVPKKALET